MFRLLGAVFPCGRLSGSQVHLPDDESVGSSTVSSVHGFCHPYILSVPLPDHDEVDEMQERGWIHDVLLWVWRQKVVLVMISSFSVQNGSKRRPLGLFFPIPCLPVTPARVWKSVPTWSLKSPRMMRFSDCRVDETNLWSSS